jgi:5'-3' exonuclease
MHKPKDKSIPPIIPNNKLQVKVFEDICKNIENLVLLCNPKRVVLAIDGPAPYAKQCQQRRRRFSSAMNKEDDDKGFDSNCITPGTKFMDYLSKYIDWFIRKKISEDPLWKDIEIVFSNEKNQGEGENKIISYIRNHGDKNESYIIHGLDADIIMLALGTELENIYVLRDDLYDPLNKYFIININDVSLQLGEIMRWTSEKYSYDKKNAIDDFIFLCFMIGNDFLPHIPSLEILEGGIMHLLPNKDDILNFNIDNLDELDDNLSIKEIKNNISNNNPNEILNLVIEIKNNSKKLNKLEIETIKEYVQLLILVLEKIKILYE